MEGRGPAAQVLNPFNYEPLAEVREATGDELERAVSTAEQGAKAMAEMPLFRRAELLLDAARLVSGEREEIARTIALECGKAIKYSRVEVERAVEILTFAAEEAKRIAGEVVPLDASPSSQGRLGFTLKVPIGVVAAITPFNFPLNLALHKVAPALAAGNSVVLKPTTVAPLTGLVLGRIFLDAGFPPGALNVVTGPGPTVGEPLVRDPRVGKVSFTGSPEVGARIAGLCPMKRLTLELGSNSAVILLGDADIGRALPRCALGAFYNSGQVCISLQRVYAHTSILEEFTEALVESAKSQVVGYQMREETDVGPMITEEEGLRLEEWIREAKAQGAEILAGGTRDFTLFWPTVLARVTRQMKVVREEAFGPVVTVSGFETLQEAVDLVNDSQYGLQAGIFTKDLARALFAAKRLQVGGVMINDVPTFRADHMPYGGVKGSGLGREGVRYAMDEMTETRMVVINP